MTKDSHDEETPTHEEDQSVAVDKECTDAKGEKVDTQEQGCSHDEPDSISNTNKTEIPNAPDSDPGIKRKIDDSDSSEPDKSSKKILHVEKEKAAVDCGHGYLKNMDITKMTYDEYLEAFKELQGRSKAKFENAQKELRQLEQEHQQQQRMHHQHSNMNFNNIPLGGGPMGGPMVGQPMMPPMSMGPGPHAVMGGSSGPFYPNMRGPPGPGMHMH